EFTVTDAAVRVSVVVTNTLLPVGPVDPDHPQTGATLQEWLVPAGTGAIVLGGALVAVRRRRGTDRAV
ncbi:MAG: LPXTG cell wall anchor domain-containing protein, partial [Microbacterium sp.]